MTEKMKKSDAYLYLSEPGKKMLDLFIKKSKKNMGMRLA